MNLRFLANQNEIRWIKRMQQRYFNIYLNLILISNEKCLMACVECLLNSIFKLTPLPIFKFLLICLQLPTKQFIIFLTGKKPFFVAVCAWFIGIT